jgi:hypothetical protein
MQIVYALRRTRDEIEAAIIAADTWREAARTDLSELSPARRANPMTEVDPRREPPAEFSYLNWP